MGGTILDFSRVGNGGFAVAHAGIDSSSQCLGFIAWAKARCALRGEKTLRAFAHPYRDSPRSRKRDQDNYVMH